MRDSLAINVLSLNPKIANLVSSEQFLDYPYKRSESFNFLPLFFTYKPYKFNTNPYFQVNYIQKEENRGYSK